MAERIVALTLGEPPGETTHWTGRVMAKVARVSLTSVQRIWRPLERDEEKHGPAKAGLGTGFPLVIPL